MAVHRAGSPAAEALQSADERLSRRCLDDEVNVIGLHGEVRDAKSSRFARDSAPESASNVANERSDGTFGLTRHRDEDGKPSHVVRPRQVPLFGAQGRWLPPRACAAPSPRSRSREPKLQLRAPCHLDWALFSARRSDRLRGDWCVASATTHLDWAMFRPRRASGVSSPHEVAATQRPILIGHCFRMRLYCIRGQLRATRARGRRDGAWRRSGRSARGPYGAARSRPRPAWRASAGHRRC